MCLRVKDEMENRIMNEKDIFYFYNSSFDPILLIKQNLLAGIQQDANYFTNAFGIRIDPTIFPEVLNELKGTIEEPPIPANWHSDIAEFGAVFRSIELDKRQEFVMCELGCAWGCWMNISGIIAKRVGHSVHLIGVEGDKEFVDLAKKTLLTNKFIPDEFTLHNGIISSKDGVALFPKHDPNKSMFGFEPIFDASKTKRIIYMQTAKYIELKQISLKSVLKKYDLVDLLHIDIQGGEESLIPSCISLLTEKISYMVIGTHSRQIEGKMFECLINAGWLLEIERPAILQLSDKPFVTVDGVQGWRNLRLLPSNKDIETKGVIKIKEKDEGLILSPAEEHFITAQITNNSNGNWECFGSNPINVSYHWLDKSGKLLTFNGERTNIVGSSLNAKETKEQMVKIIAPSKKGEYILDVTLVEEGKQWFMTPDFLDDTMVVTVR
jgi:FkbM family methyltransferase